MKKNLFLSWSGERSRCVAEALHNWLPLVIQAVKPWMSAADIQKGSRGLYEVTQALQGIKIGIVCVTPENLSAPWLLFEAGALSKTVDERTRLCTYLFCGMRPEDVPPPLGMFQATRAERDETLRLLRSINTAVSDEPIPTPALDNIFEAMWPKLERTLSSIPAPETPAPATRPIEEMVAEILEITRAEASRRRKTDPLDAFLPLFEDIMPALPSLRQVLRGAIAQSIGPTVVQAEPAVSENRCTMDAPEKFGGTRPTA